MNTQEKIEEVIEWIYNLPLQTLTDELKDDIVEKIEELKMKEKLNKMNTQENNKLMKCKVEWTSERCDDNDNNNGFEYGIYTFNVIESEYDQEAGLGTYDIIDAQWYKTKKERNLNY